MFGIDKQYIWSKTENLKIEIYRNIVLLGEFNAHGGNDSVTWSAALTPCPCSVFGPLCLCAGYFVHKHYVCTWHQDARGHW